MSKLVDLNFQFYQTFAAAFAATRRRIQPGVSKTLRLLPAGGNWLDLGCGSGALASAWVQAARTGSYLGVDFSPALLAEARRGLSQVLPNLSVEFTSVNLFDPHWQTNFTRQSFDGILAFAVLHHLPGMQLRRRILLQVNSLLAPRGMFIHSNWQFQHSPRLMARRLPWETIGLSDQDVEQGDTLLDWRHTLPGDPQQIGLRYVHLFSREELADLAQQSGFEIAQEFESDGRGGRLALYQLWRVKERFGPDHLSSRI